MNKTASGPHDMGGTHLFRGVEFQVYSTVFYMLLRLQKHPNLRMEIETFEDAQIDYPGTSSETHSVRELIQSKKVEKGHSTSLRRGHGDDIVELGRFSPSNLRAFVEQKRTGGSAASTLAQSQSTFYTALLLTEVSKHLRPFLPWKAGESSAVSLWTRPDFNECFPVAYQHDHDPVQVKRHLFATENIRRRIRALILPSWEELRIACEVLLRNFYRIPSANAESAVAELIQRYRNRATAKNPAAKVLDAEEVNVVLDAFRAERSSWMSASSWLRHLLEATEALAECDSMQEARRFAELASSQSAQVRQIYHLRNFVEILQKALWVEHRLQLPGFAERLFASLDPLRVQMMIVRGTLESARGNMILAAFAIYLLTATADDGFGGFRGGIEQARRALISASSTEIRPLYRCLVAVLCNDPAEAIREAAADNRWQLVWERALASVIARLVRPDADALSTNLSPEQIARWIQELPRELSGHASNMEFALTYQLLKPAVLPAEFEKQLRNMALQRADDETVGAIRWLLTDFPGDIDKLPTWYVWTLLRGTALRPTYLAWEGTIELAARAETFRKRMTHDVEALSS